MSSHPALLVPRLDLVAETRARHEQVKAQLAECVAALRAAVIPLSNLNDAEAVAAWRQCYVAIANVETS